MSDGRPNRYWTLAILEFFLIITGILIALQVNNWNELRKKQNLKNVYVQALIRDLTEDKSDLNLAIERFNVQMDQIKNISERLNQPNATPDSLLSILFNDFDMGMPPFVSYNLNTYLTMQSTGNIDLLSLESVEKLRRLYRIHDDELYYRNGNMDILKSLFAEYALVAPLNFSPIMDSPVLQAAIREMNSTDFVFVFSNYLSMKMITLTNSLIFYDLIIETTNELIAWLEDNELNH